MDQSNTPVKFDIYEGDKLVRTEVLAEQTIKIGKLSSSHVRIDDESVSRMHAVVEVNGPNEVVILDLGSATGTYVNGEPITKRKLNTGDQL
ncbi:MAG: FHA domain-containing protein, partial [Myxococcales bacterium]|nr:FHA domain-containing protein [Myxococcales bacterium]